MKTLVTERLIIRPFRDRDLNDFYEYASNRNIGPAAGWKPHETKRESKRVLRDFISKREVWAIARIDNDRVIGSIGLHPDRKRDNERAKMLGYVLQEAHWGKGLVTEAAKAVIAHAFENEKIDLVSVYHYPYNHRSRRVIEKCGFRYEGTLRNSSVRYDGNVFDDVCYSMTKDEYVAHKSDGVFDD